MTRKCPQHERLTFGCPVCIANIERDERDAKKAKQEAAKEKAKKKKGEAKW